MIALSIVFVVAEVLHGYGFAGTLTEVGLPDNAIPLALAFFNPGVEPGQLLFVAAFFALVRAVSSLLPQQPTTWTTAARLSLPSAYVIGTLASVWLTERIDGFWT